MNASAVRTILTAGRATRTRLAVAVLAAVAASGSAVALAATSAWLISRASEQPPVLHLMVAIVSVRAFGLTRGVLRYGERLAAHDTVLRILGELRVRVVTRIERVVPGDRGSVPTGDLLSRFVADVDGLMDLWVRVLLPGVVSIVVALASVGLLAAIWPPAALVVGLATVAAFVVAPWSANRQARVAAAVLEPKRASYRREFLEVLDGAPELAVLGALAPRRSRLRELDAEATAAAVVVARAAGVGAAVSVLAAGAAWIGALLVALPAVRSGELDPVLLAVCVLTPLALHEVVSMVSTAGHELPLVAGRAERVAAVLALPDAVTDPSEPRPAPFGALGIRADFLTLGWADDPPVVRDLTFDLPAGSVSALVGASGSGKSTLVAALLKFLHPRSGRLALVAGDTESDLAELTGDTVRSLVGWCAQDPHVFDSTLRANLVLARTDADEAALWDVLARVRLAEWVRSLPAGLDTLVGEHGRNLSGGQRQRLALARVLLADRPVVVFDEPTEHLDDAVAAEVLGELVDASAGRTVLIVTHRTDLLVGLGSVHLVTLG